MIHQNPLHHAVKANDMTALITTRQLILTSCSAITVLAATTAIDALPVPSTVLTACSNGEEQDTYTGNCIPYLVPNSPSSNSLCPPGVHGAECGSAEIKTVPTAPTAPTGPRQALEDVSTPNF